MLIVQRNNLKLKNNGSQILCSMVITLFANEISCKQAVTSLADINFVFKYRWERLQNIKKRQVAFKTDTSTSTPVVPLSLD